MNPADICIQVLPLDCQRILIMLNAKGLCNAEIARIIAAEKSTVRHWRANSRHPQDPHARRLVALFDLYYPGVQIPQRTSCANPPAGELTPV